MEKTWSSYFMFLKPEMLTISSVLSSTASLPAPLSPWYLQQLSLRQQRPQFSKALKHKLNYQDKLKGFAELGLQSWMETC